MKRPPARCSRRNAAAVASSRSSSCLLTPVIYIDFLMYPIEYGMCLPGDAEQHGCCSPHWLQQWPMSMSPLPVLLAKFN